VIKNYLKLAIRNITNSKIFSFINISGLSIGLAASFVMLLIVYHELSYDKHHENLDRIAKVVAQKSKAGWTAVHMPFVLAPTIKEKFLYE